MPKPLYLRLVNLSKVEVFDEMLGVIRETGPSGALPGHYEAHVPVHESRLDRVDGSLPDHPLRRRQLALAILGAQHHQPSPIRLRPHPHEFELYYDI